MKILVLDNYDSFTYNLVYILRKLGVSPDVIRNDKLSAQDALRYNGILLSPGPGIPSEAGNMPSIIDHCSGEVPILGICLGHQAIAEHLGGVLINENKVYHGVQTGVNVIKKVSMLFENMDERFLAGRYHSWEVSPKNLPASIEVLAKSDDESIMAIQNQDQQLFGLQFHPESVMTKSGPIIIENFIQHCKQNAS